MIGNDIVDLALAKKESNWKRKGFLDKIFTTEEQLLISQSQNPENMVWNLWSRKEAAYKIYNRQTQNRIYNPLQLVCSDTHLAIGKVIFNEAVYFVKTEISEDYIHSIAVNNIGDFDRVNIVDSNVKIEKNHAAPYILDNEQNLIPVSVSNHGRFEIKVMLS